jgi:hypothetical protein
MATDVPITHARPTSQRDVAAEPVEINVGVFVAHSPDGDVEALESLADRVTADARAALEDASGAQWRFHLDEPTRLSDDEARRPSDFLDEASLRMAEGPFDLVVVLTNVGLVSRRQRIVPGLASEIARVAVVSTRRLVMSPRGEPVRPLDADAIRWNTSALLVHLIGQLLGLPANRHGVSASFAFDAARRGLPAFTDAERDHLRDVVEDVPDPEEKVDGAVGVLRFHVVSAARNVGLLARAVWRSRAPLLPLSLPKLVAAAVAPTIILVFSAETWDVGLNMGDAVAVAFAVVAVVGSALFLVWVQNLTFPRKDRRLITEHLAVVNVAVGVIMLLAVVGLFVMVGGLMLVVELFMFPPGLMSSWPTLEDPEVTLGDKIRLASFVSSIGVLTGALAGGLESRNFIRQLALFRREP